MNDETLNSFGTSTYGAQESASAGHGDESSSPPKLDGFDQLPHHHQQVGLDQMTGRIPQPHNNHLIANHPAGAALLNSLLMQGASSMSPNMNIATTSPRQAHQSSNLHQSTTNPFNMVAGILSSLRNVQEIQKFTTTTLNNYSHPETRMQPASSLTEFPVLGASQQLNSTRQVIPQQQQQLQSPPDDVAAHQQPEQLQQQTIPRTQQQQQPRHTTPTSILLASASSSIKSNKVPCKARGVPPDHNVTTAYFIIPENLGHGEELACCHPACQGGGIKFLYCAVCGIPVAKRNFRQRHDHGIAPVNDVTQTKATITILQQDKISNKNATSSDHNNDNDKETTASSTIPNSDEVLQPTQQTVPPQSSLTPPLLAAGVGERENEQPQQQSAESTTTANSKVVHDNHTSVVPPLSGKPAPAHRVPENVHVHGGNKQVTRQSTTTTDKPMTQPPPPAPIIDQDDVIGEELRDRDWATLLDERPSSDDDEKISSWLQQVLRVSNIRKPYQPSSGQRRKRRRRRSSKSENEEEDMESDCRRQQGSRDSNGISVQKKRLRKEQGTSTEL